MLAYILTRSHNDYSQHGSYFVAWFHRKPTIEELKATLILHKEITVDDKIFKHILKGGSRQQEEEVWYYLTPELSANDLLEHNEGRP